MAKRSKLEKLMGRKLTARDKATNEAKVASVAKEVAITPGESWAHEMARRGHGKMLYRAKGTKKWKKEPPKDGHYEYALRFRGDNGSGGMSKTAAMVREAMIPGWREGLKRNASGVEIESPKGNVFSVGIEFCKVCGFTPDYCEGHK